MRPEPCEVQGISPESIVVQGCHVPYVVHGRRRGHGRIIIKLRIVDFGLRNRGIKKNRIFLLYALCSLRYAITEEEIR